VKRHLAILFSIVLLTPLLGYGQAKKGPVNYLGTPGTLSLQKNAFDLVWSAHPDPSLYKQEYLVKGDAFPKYKSMITIDFSLTDASLDQAVRTKISELEQLKKANYDVNFEVIANAATGEKILDCLIGQTAAEEQNSLIERDIYRFKTIKAKSGQKGIILFAASTRKYGKEIKPYLIKLKMDKPILVSEVSKFSLPEINITK
jgi:hypothetical protein